MLKLIPVIAISYNKSLSAREFECRHEKPKVLIQDPFKPTVHGRCRAIVQIVWCNYRHDDLELEEGDG